MFPSLDSNFDICWPIVGSGFKHDFCSSMGGSRWPLDRANSWSGKHATLACSGNKEVNYKQEDWWKFPGIQHIKVAFLCALHYICIFITIIIAIYIYIPPSSEVCKISDPNEKNAPLAPWGAKKCPGPEIRSWSELDAIYCWRVAFQRKYGPGCHTKINHFKLYEFLYLGHPKSEEIHMNFVTWDVPKVSHFI